VPNLVAADAGFYSGKIEAVAKGKGFKRAHFKSLNQKPRTQNARFRNGQKWRTGCSGRISVAKRRMKRWPGRARGDCRQSHQHRPCNPE
jgi:IS5 family transposase